MKLVCIGDEFVTLSMVEAFRVVGSERIELEFTSGKIKAVEGAVAVALLAYLRSNSISLLEKPEPADSGPVVVDGGEGDVGPFPKPLDTGEGA
jgi:hypothetical protein